MTKLMFKKVPPALLQVMCGLYPDSKRARVFINQIPEASADFMDFSGASKPMWFGILDELRKNNLLRRVVEVAKTEYPNYQWQNIESIILNDDPNLFSADLTDSEWRGDDNRETLERITCSSSTLLPISFLEAGMIASQSVAKVVVPGLGVGSGFLVKDNILLTNNHVLVDAKTAGQAKLLFNYQLTVDGRDATVTELHLDPSDLFVTSKEQDWTAVRVQGAANESWGHLPIATAAARVDDCVNIIQHPGGQRKQVALHHNFVRSVTCHNIQYLTDTMGGSSGSPVLNLQWQVVGIHSAGGLHREPAGENSMAYFRNTGVPIGLVAEKLVDIGVSR